MVAHASRVLVSVSHETIFGRVIYTLKSFLRSEKFAMARTPLPTRETRALPNPAARLSEIALVDFEPNKLFHTASLRGDR
jgi:hypothetical protein